jgi:predicted GIY-YIG superfamily endonuclease
LRHEKRRLSRRSKTKADFHCDVFAVPQRLRLGRPAFFVHDPVSKAQPMNGFYYVYILVSEVGEEMHYSGITSDLGSRLAEHNRGKCPHSAKHRPWKIETAVAFRSEAKARRFERYLKTGSGREFSRRHF